MNHPNIVTIHEIDTLDGVDFMVMEYVDGTPLDRSIPAKGLPIEQTLAYAVQIADALAAAHTAGIVHRDIKPGNIVVTPGGRVKVLDFGLAKLVERAGSEDLTVTAEGATRAGVIVGTVAYASPEQIEAKPVDARSDVFSFGAVLYEMLTGRRPFQGESQLSTMAAILRDTPQPEVTVRPGLPLNSAASCSAASKKPGRALIAPAPSCVTIWRRFGRASPRLRPASAPCCISPGTPSPRCW